MYTEGKTLHVPVIDNGLIPRLCFHRNPTPWTARLLWYAICNMLWVERMRYVMQIRYGSRECNMRYANTLWAAWMWYANTLWAARKRYAIYEYAMGRANIRYTNRLRAMSNCKVAFCHHTEPRASKLTVTWQWQLMVLQLISYCVLATILTSYMQVIACHILGCLVQRPCEREGKTFPLSYGPGTTLTVALWIGRWNAISASLQLGTQTYAT